MRLLLVLTEFPPRVGGMQTHAAYVARHLVRSGHDVRVVTYRVAADDDGSPAHDAALPYPVERVLTRFGHFHNLDLLERIARAFGPDLIYASTVFFGELAERLGVPVVCRSVGNDVLRPWIGYPFRFMRRAAASRWFEAGLYRVFRSLARPEALDALLRTRRRDLMVDAARRAAHVMANSRFTARHLHGIGVDDARVTVLPGGVESRRFAADRGTPNSTLAAFGVPAERFVLLTACRFEHKKGVDLLIDALPRLLDDLPQAHLVIAGGGRLDRRLRARAAASPAADRITFTGIVPHATVDHLFAAADLFVLASREHVDRATGLRDAETMGRVLCEANAAGVPVVATRSGGIPSVIEHGVNGLLFPEDDAAEFRAAVLRVAFEDGLAGRLVAAGRRRAREEFDWSYVLAEHERCFARILEQSSRTAAAPLGSA